MGKIIISGQSSVSGKRYGIDDQSARAEIHLNDRSSVYGGETGIIVRTGQALQSHLGLQNPIPEEIILRTYELAQSSVNSHELEAKLDNTDIKDWFLQNGVGLAQLAVALVEIVRT